MADKQQILSLLIELMGDKEAVARLQQVADAQGAIAEGTRQQGAAAAEAGEKQDEQNLKLQDFTKVLSAIDPSLGAIVGRMTRAAQTFGDLGGKTLDLATITKGATDIFTKFGSTLGLLAAGGAVAIGIGLIVSQVQRMREEFEKATRAIKEQQDAVNELRRAEDGRKRSIEEISDKRRRGGFDAATARAAEAQARRALEHTPDLGEEAVAEAAGQLGDLGLTDEGFRAGAFLIGSGRLKLTGRESAGLARRKLDSALQRHAAAVIEFATREYTQAKETADSAFTEKQAIGGSNESLRAIARRALGVGVPESEIDAALKLLEERGSAGEIVRSLAPREEYSRLHGLRTIRPVPTPEEARAIRIDQFLQQQRAETLDRQAPINIYNNQRNIVPGAVYQELTKDNGESRARALERGMP